MDRGLAIILGFAAFAFGATIASFLNVVIWRVPRGESIVSPPSHCPKCGAAIRWWQNVPILSYLALRGRCASCREPISPRYPAVEVLGGALYLAALWRLTGGFQALTPWIGVELVFWWIWLALMIAGSFIDFDHQLLPDFTTVGGMVLGLVFAGAELVRFLLTTEIVSPGWWDYSCGFVMSLAGLLLGFGLLWLVRRLGTMAFRREAMGEGDVYLMGAVGAMFGPYAVLVALIVSAFAGSLAGVAMLLLKKARLGGFTEIPYGPYICLGCLAWMFRGPELMLWYIGLLGLDK